MTRPHTFSVITDADWRKAIVAARSRPNRLSEKIRSRTLCETRRRLLSVVSKPLSFPQPEPEPL
jgi:hypothetical protein